jgi:protease IV
MALCGRLPRGIQAPSPSAAGVLALLQLSLLASALAADPRPVTLGVQQPVPVPLVQDDATALGGNPALLGFSGGWHLDFAQEVAAGNGTRHGRGLYFSLGTPSQEQEFGLAAGLSAEWLRPQGDCAQGGPTCWTRTSAGLAARFGWLSLGAAWHKLSSDEVTGTTFWDVGATARPLECLALGGAAYDLNGSIAGQQLPTRYQASVAVRPYCEQVVLELDTEFTSCGGTPAFGTPGAARVCGFANPDFRLSGEWALVDGVKLLAGLKHTIRTEADSRWTGEVGLQLELGNLRLRGGGTGVPDYAYQTYAAGLSSESYQRPGVLRGAWGAVLVDLDRTLRRPDNFVAQLFGPSPDPQRATLDLLARLAADGAVRAVVLRLSQAPLSMARADELRKGIEGLREAGKKTVFYLENADDPGYYLATSADRVYATPQAGLSINGLSATAYFAAAGLDKLGVKAEFFRVGAYKNAPDAFTRSDMSAEQREVQTALLGDLGARFSKAVSERRGIDEAKLKGLLDRGMLTTREAIDAGLLDGAAYPDQLEEVVGKLLGGSRVTLRRVGTEAPVLREERWGARPKVAVIRVEGEIGPGSQGGLLGESAAGSTEIARRIRQAADDAGVVALVVRIDSPGGDGNASDLIWRELVRARKEKGKPVVASMGSVAASGGYYVAMGADAIWAEPSTITGSIGVFAGHFDASELLGKLGVTAVTVKTAASADFTEPTRPLTDAERRRFQQLVDEFYEGFVSKVAESRKLSREAVDKVARGRIWTGAQAQGKGLVDHLGGLRDAVVEAKRRAGLAADADVDLLDEGLAAAGPLQRLTGAAEGAWSGAAARALGLGELPLSQPLSTALKALAGLGAPGTVRARLPYELDIH